LKKGLHMNENQERETAPDLIEKVDEKYAFVW
jgi:hypothetical protein